ncbi:hypothetical protein [Anaerocolumna xylanovorans]|uniref:NUP210 Ig-like domain-containing protein n=1 Tax=Anaerocolumna xylanovorans DSM 12503 TaxID=1121345 RepID=A0A1M7Y6N5_9FIRM|nr:hypothetical protein [Anaerocolumna xylanovorans]SHO48325.1 hypothetical protein SAMN02745217_01773 [Anaerocolumna xylanovorans DSM 12503]
MDKNTFMKESGSYTYVAKGYGVKIADILWSSTKESILAVNKKTGRAMAKKAGTALLGSD